LRFSSQKSVLAEFSWTLQKKSSGRKCAEKNRLDESPRSKSAEYHKNSDERYTVGFTMRCVWWND